MGGWDERWFTELHVASWLLSARRNPKMTEPSLQHPNGVQPWGNYLFAQGRDTRNQGKAVSALHPVLLFVLNVADRTAYVELVSTGSRACCCLARAKQCTSCRAWQAQDVI